MSDARFERGGGCWKGRKIADIMEEKRITGIRELYNISETGNQPAFFNLESVNGLQRGRKEICVPRGPRSYLRKEGEGRCTRVLKVIT